MEYFYLKNKNTKLLAFAVSVDECKQEYCEEIEHYEDINIPGFIDINTWCIKRNYAAKKFHLEARLFKLNIGTTLDFIQNTYGLSLNDTLWICPIDSSLTWEMVSLYSNFHKDPMEELIFSDYTGDFEFSEISPEFTSEGSFEKCWIKKNGIIYSYKKGSAGFANSGLEPYSEFYASQYSSLICKKAISYDLLKYRGHLVSSCELFTSEDEGFTPFYKYIDSSRYYSFNAIFNVIKKLGFEEDFLDMVLLDSVIMNPDRHLGNFGFIVDNTTFKIKRFAPIFDNNMSLLARVMDRDLSLDSSIIPYIGHSIGESFVPLGKRCITNRTKKILRILIRTNIIEHPKYNLPKKRLAAIEKIIRNQIKELLS